MVLICDQPEGVTQCLVRLFSTSTTPTAAPAADQPTTLFAPLALLSLALPAQCVTRVLASVSPCRPTRLRRRGRASGDTPSCLGTMRRARHGYPARQAVPSESPCCPGRVCAVAREGLPVRIVLTDRRCGAHKASSRASYEPIGFIEGAPMPLQSQPAIISAHARLPSCSYGRVPSDPHWRGRGCPSPPVRPTTGRAQVGQGPLYITRQKGGSRMHGSGSSSPFTSCHIIFHGRDL